VKTRDLYYRDIESYLADQEAVDAFFAAEPDLTTYPDLPRPPVPHDAEIAIWAALADSEGVALAA